MEYTGEYILEMKNIVKLFPGVRALDGMNLKIRPGKVHVIAGENGAGKSTLMKVINGDYVAEEGEVIYKGQKLGKRTIMETIQMGISMIRQEMNPIRQMTVAENIYLGREPQKVKGFVDFKILNDRTNQLLQELEIPYKATQKLETMSIAAQQQIEIAKAMSTNASVIIMDEPTSAISDTEVNMLFRQIQRLKEKGVAIIYITHKMDEIRRIADEITIIRDGSWVSSGPIEEYKEDDIISLMVGRKISNIFPKEEVLIGDVVMEVKGLTSRGVFRDIDFKVRAGEILGFSGLVGAGRSEVMRAIFGLDPYESGEIMLNGRELKIKSTEDAIANGIAMASEDRRAEGIVPVRSVRENISLAFIRQFKRQAKIVNKKEEKKAVNNMIDTFNIKVSNPEQEIRTLSGGNQQKAILAKWLLGDIKVLILDEPTRGIDVGSKAEIHKLMCDYAKKGIAIIMISSELPEILGMSDRVMVMREGRIAAELTREEASQEAIMKLAT
ncbi:sugar ABC transporter ATP-binding protein [Ruminococcus gauvreauii]|uniref:Sugar ABC transporter ATP-binding protein n=1 Tax=Ruminococcus gauvreauii TaxID=438033 RepID=A0ABY5VFT5_9FIRM|nr:sugar ABC transporter ATP-binding protein [Ruminococcus gauvreauii]UWP58791.1 sugar ABC transporter ATP-binding protein [Ruminococcus gauvreauii]